MLEGRYDTVAEQCDANVNNREDSEPLEDYFKVSNEYKSEIMITIGQVHGVAPEYDQHNKCNYKSGHKVAKEVHDGIMHLIIDQLPPLQLSEDNIQQVPHADKQ